MSFVFLTRQTTGDEHSDSRSEENEQGKNSQLQTTTLIENGT